MKEPNLPDSCILVYIRGVTNCNSYWSSLLQGHFEAIACKTVFVMLERIDNVLVVLFFPSPLPWFFLGWSLSLSQLEGHLPTKRLIEQKEEDSSLSVGS